MQNYRFEAGYSLIQLIIVIVIVSLGLVAAMGIAQIELKKKKETKLVQTFEDINKKLLAYYTGSDENGDPIKRLPCPARQDLPIDDINFGTEDCTSVAIVAGNVPHPDTGANMRVMIGALPTRELSVSTETAFDVFGGQLIYAVSEDLTSDTNYLRHEMSAVQRQDNSGAFAGLPLPFMVVSTGETRRGAYNVGGTLIEPCTGTDREQENCDGDSVFLDAFIAEQAGGGFIDDRLGYDGAFFAKAGNTILINLECPDGEFLTGVVNGEAECTPLVTTGGSGSGGARCGGGCGCDNVCVGGHCVQRGTSACR